MRRVVFCIIASFIAGTGLATVLGLGVAALSAAAFKSKAGLDKPIYNQMHGIQPAIVVAIGLGFAIGAGVMVWLFYRTDQSQSDPTEGGAGGRTKV